MSTKDKNLIRKLGLSQKDVATALGRSQQTVSSGIAAPHDYFDLRKLAILESYIAKNHSIPQEEFLEAKYEYRSGESSSPDKASLEIGDDFTQLWIFSGASDAEQLAREILAIVQPLQNETSRTIAVVVPEDGSVDLLFQLLAQSLFKNDSTPQIYIFKSPIAQLPLELYIRDGHTASPTVLTHLYDGTMARLPSEIALRFRQLFNRHGFGLDREQFLQQEELVKISGDLVWRYNTDNIVGRIAKYVSIEGS